MQDEVQNFSPIKQRILYFVSTLGISKRDFYAKTGISRGTLESNTGITEDTIAKFFATYHNISPQWLLTGKGDILLSAESKPSIQVQDANKLSAELSAEEKNDEFLITSPSTPLKEIAVEHIPVNMVKGRETAYKPIPFVSESAVAGFGSVDFAIKERDVKDYYVIPKFKDSNIDFMIEIHGESMQPTFRSGDVVACTIIRESRFIQWNRTHIIATDEQGLLIKRIKKGSTEGTVKLVSDNPDYDPFEVYLNEIKGLALVQGLVRLD